MKNVSEQRTTDGIDAVLQNLSFGGFFEELWLIAIL